jgi:hypothetical protein
MASISAWRSSAPSICKLSRRRDFKISRGFHWIGSHERQSEDFRSFDCFPCEATATGVFAFLVGIRDFCLYSVRGRTEGAPMLSQAGRRRLIVLCAIVSGGRRMMISAGGKSSIWNCGWESPVPRSGRGRGALPKTSENFRFWRMISTRGSQSQPGGVPIPAGENVGFPLAGLHGRGHLVLRLRPGCVRLTGASPPGENARLLAGG